MVETTQPDPALEERGEHGTRRDFLYIATGAVGAVTAGAAIWPLVDQMNPSASVLALATIDVDVSQIAEGSQITVQWRGKPVFVRHRTPAEVEEARSVDLSDLPDNNSRSAQAPGEPATDENRAIGENGQYLVMMGICTHLGCVPLGDGAGNYDGWFCPCHGSHYDSSGRVRQGPAPENLHVPELAFDGTTVSILEQYQG